MRRIAAPARGACCAAVLALTVAPFAARAEIRIRLESAAPQAGTATGIEVEVLGSGDFALGDARPRAWLIPEPDGPCAPPAAGLARSEIDGWLLILRNADNTISAVDPTRSLASSNIAWIRPVDGGAVTDWEVDRTQGLARLWQASDIGSTMRALRLSDGTLAEADTGITRSAADPRAAFSALAGRSYHLSADGRTLIADGGAGDATIALPAAAARIEPSPDGRWMMALSPDEGLVQAIDLATGRVRHAFAIHAGFTRSAFSRDYLYLREADRPYVTMIRLPSLTGDAPHVVAIPVGLTPSSDPMTPMGDDGMAFLHGAENAVYLYMESGMADNHGTMRSPTEMLAPYEVVKLRGSKAVDLAVYDRSLRSIAPGRFRAHIVPAHGGPWRIVVRDRQSGQIGCLDFAAAGSRAAPAAAAPFRLVKAEDGSPRFAVTGEAADALPDRIGMLATVPGSNWQRPVTAIREADGRYRIADPLPRASRIALFAQTLPTGREPLVLGPLP